MSRKNMQVLLAHRPKGWVQESDFRIVESDIPELVDRQVLVQNTYLSLDPYMHGRMNDTKSYAAKAELGDVMVGGVVQGAARRPLALQGEAGRQPDTSPHQPSQAVSESVDGGLGVPGAGKPYLHRAGPLPRSGAREGGACGDES